MVNKARILRYSAFFISICSIVAIFLFTDFYKNINSLFHVNIYFLVAAICLQFIAYFFWALRIKILVSLFDRNISLKNSYIAVLITVFYSAITPSSSGGEPMRIKVIQDNIKSYGIASAVVISERSIDFIVLSLVIPVLIILGILRGNLRIIAGLSSVGILIAITLFLYLIIEKIEVFQKIIYCILSKFIKKVNLYESIKKELTNLRESIIRLAHVPKIYLLVVGMLTLISWSLAFLSLPLSIESLGISIPLSFAISFQVVLVLASTLFFTPGGSGLVELGSAYVLAKYITYNKLGAAIFLWRFSTYYIPMIIGAVTNIIYFNKK